MNKGKLRELLKETSHLVHIGCLNEARIKVAVALNLFDIVRIMIAIDQIQTIEKGLPRGLIVYREMLTQRVLRHAGEQFGPVIQNKIQRALIVNN